MKRCTTLLLTLGIAALLSACQPEIGSKAWCETLQAKSKGDWTVNEATDYAKHCLLR